LWALLIIHKANAAEGLPPYLKSDTPGKMCVAIFDKFNELVAIDCDVPAPVDTEKKEPIRKGE
jgi:hypothetical protein